MLHTVYYQWVSGQCSESLMYGTKWFTAAVIAKASNSHSL